VSKVAKCLITCPSFRKWKQWDGVTGRAKCMKELGAEASHEMGTERRTFDRKR